MTEAEMLFYETGNKIPDAVQSQMFGKKSFKINGKAFLCFFEDEMVFKLPLESVLEALKLEGTKHFDPSGKNRPMKEWVQVPFSHSDKWKGFAGLSCEYVKKNI